MTSFTAMKPHLERFLIAFGDLWFFDWETGTGISILTPLGNKSKNPHQFPPGKKSNQQPLWPPSINTCSPTKFLKWHIKKRSEQFKVAKNYILFLYFLLLMKKKAECWPNHWLMKFFSHCWDLRGVGQVVFEVMLCRVVLPRLWEFKWTLNVLKTQSLISQSWKPSNFPELLR